MWRGQPKLSEYRSSEKGKTAGFRIVWYREETLRRIIVLYVGNPFGDGHKRLWTTLRIESDWVYEPVGKLKSKEVIADSE